VRADILTSGFHVAWHEVQTLIREYEDSKCVDAITKAISEGGPRYTSSGRFKADSSNLVMTEVSKALAQVGQVNSQ